MDHDERIAQWENMTRQAPDGMAWFSLGSAYRDAERHEEAVTALKRAVEMDEGLSRAYQLLGQSLKQLGRNGEAIEVLTQGFGTAATRGDVMPQRAMASLLESLGAPVPATETPAAAAPVVEGDQILDRRSGQRGTRMAEPPMRGALGAFIQAHYSAETWREWIGMGTKVINELRLDFSNAEHQALYDQHMTEWLGIRPEEVEA